MGYRIDYQYKKVYIFSEEHNAYLFYCSFAALTKKELAELERMA